MSPSTKMATPNAIKFEPKKVDSIAASNAPSAVATIRSRASGTVELSGDYITTIVAIADQYGSDVLSRRANTIESVAATAMRNACGSDGRFSFFGVQSFIACNHLRTQMFVASTGAGSFLRREIERKITVHDVKLSDRLAEIRARAKQARSTSAASFVDDRGSHEHNTYSLRVVAMCRPLRFETFEKNPKRYLIFAVDFGESSAATIKAET
jgi:hypothetical protein